METNNRAEREAMLTLVERMPSEQKSALLKEMLLHLKKRSSEAIMGALTARQSDIPLSIFSQDKLSCLESIVKYLKEVKGMKIGKIARLLNRDNRTIWATYANAVKKMPEPLSFEDGGARMDAAVIADRTLSVLQHVVKFAKGKGMTNHKIGLMLHLDDRTIWSVYDIVKKKRRQ